MTPDEIEIKAQKLADKGIAELINGKYLSRSNFAEFISAALREASSGIVPEKLWLWRNGQFEFLAFDNPYPCESLYGDPMILGETSGYALFRKSVNGRPERTDEFFADFQMRQAAPLTASSGIVPEGHALVPMEPTQEMHIAGYAAQDIAEKEYPDRGTPVSCCYAAMLSAAPPTALLKHDDVWGEALNIAAKEADNWPHEILAKRIRALKRGTK